MTRLHGIDLGAVVRASGGTMPAVTLHKVSVAALDPDDLAAGPGETIVDHVAQGFAEMFKSSEIDGTRVVRGDKKVILRAHTLADGVVVTAQDRVTVDGVEYSIVAVTRDPAKAQWVIHARGPRP